MDRSSASVPAAGNCTAFAAELVRHLPEDHGRIAPDFDDAVIHRIFAAGLDLPAALGLIGDHRGASKVHDAIDKLDQAVRGLRDTMFGTRQTDSPGDGTPG